MHWPFQCFNQVFHLRIARSKAGIHGDGGDDKRLFRLRITARIQAAKKQAVHRPFEGSAGAPLLLLDEHGEVVVDGESGPHIMMLG